MEGQPDRHREVMSMISGAIQILGEMIAAAKSASHHRHDAPFRPQHPSAANADDQ